jgi:cytochrome c5
MEGFNNYLMPPKGGCRNCNQKEVYAAVYYMMETSGIKLKKSDKK